MIKSSAIPIIQEERALWVALDKAGAERRSCEYLFNRQRISQAELSAAINAEEDARKAWHGKRMEARAILAKELEPLGLSLEDIAGVAR